MANVYLSDSNFERIGRAIRRRLGTEETFKPSEMAAAIRSLSVATGGAGQQLEDALLNRTLTELDNKNLKAIRNMIAEQPELTDINCPNVTEIVEKGVWKCPKLINVYLDSLETAGDYAFFGCEKLAQAHFIRLKVVSGQMFSRCSSLVWANFPAVEEIQFGAFQYCPNLQDVTIGQILGDEGKMVTIRSQVFDNSPNAYFRVPSNMLSAYQSEYPEYKFEGI